MSRLGERDEGEAKEVRVRKKEEKARHRGEEGNAE